VEFNLNPILLFLESIYLQARPTGNPIIDFFNNLLNPPVPTTEGTIIITPSYIPLIQFFIFIFFLVIGARYVVNARRHPNTETPVGICQFLIMGQGLTEMWVSEYNAPLRPSIIRALKQNKKFAPAVDEILKLRDQGKLFFYQAFYRTVKDLVTSTVRGRRVPALIISTASLSNPKYCFSQSRPKFSWASLGWDYMKTSVLHSSTEKIDSETPDGKPMDVWLFAPIPDVKEKPKYEGEQKSENVEEEFEVWGGGYIPEKIVMRVDILPYSDEIAKVASSMVSASKQVSFIRGLEDNITTQDGDLQQRDSVINRLRSKANILKLLVGQKKLIGTDIPPSVYKPKDIIQWIGLTILAIIFMGLLPNVLPQLAGVDRTILEVFGGLAIFGIYMLTKKGRKQQEQDMLEEEGIDVNANM